MLYEVITVQTAGIFAASIVGSQIHHNWDDISQSVADMAHTVSGKFHDFTDSRITSYNVCYTKLLRNVKHNVFATLQDILNSFSRGSIIIIKHFGML